MNKVPYLSLCIPTNGITEWVVPVIESIYSQKCDNDDFEVIVTDNGKNPAFRNKMTEYANRYSNFIYKKTEAILFLNQIEAFKLATGELIKFVNHRMTLNPSAVQYLIDFVKENTAGKPVAYFSNGQLKTGVKKCDSFDEYVKTLSYWSSWSAGTAIWKRDFEKIDLTKEFNPLFPHTDIIFANKSSKQYVVDDTPLFSEIPADITKKGNYDLFNAFAVEYPAIIKKLYEEGKISKETYHYVKKENSYFVSELFWNYMIRKSPCSYKLDGYKNASGVYYSDFEIKRKALLIGCKRILSHL